MPGGRAFEPDTARFLRTKREQLGMSLRELAALAEVGLTTVNDVELERIPLRSLPAAARLADALGLDRLALIGRAVYQFPAREARGREFPLPADGVTK
ncbi:multiprotein-bridging factor 1 family protein [Amycolatopsis sp. NPDC059021]|uniref:helix-turn-helix domain-containing protein n=1 Tax=Amycolatopsis sp. NPDC059021 TaxID=3346704 RepID=UPI00366B0203